MKLDVTVETIIARPREQVADYAMQPENEPVWITGIQSSRLLTAPPVTVGTEVERLASFLGKRIEYALRVVEHEPARLVVMESSKGPFPMRVTYAFEDRDGGTLARLRVQGEAGGFYRFAEPLMAGAVRRNLTNDLKNLKGILEHRAVTA